MTMRTLGLLGGMSWESTAIYYERINREVGERLGGLHSASLILVSVDFDHHAAMQREGRWDELGDLLADNAMRLEAAGAEAVMICTNTMHLVAPRIESSISVPLLHIVDATGSALRAAGHQRVGLLGTRFTMSGEFYRGKLVADHGLEVLVPDADEWDEINRVIFDELCRGVFTAASRNYYVGAIERLAARGAEAIILGCTEIGLLIEAKDSPLPVFDTTWVHASAAVDFALSSR